jgi:hypothetical protein
MEVAIAYVGTISSEYSLILGVMLLFDPCQCNQYKTLAIIRSDHTKNDAILP